MSKKQQARYGSPYDPRFKGTGKTSTIPKVENHDMPSYTGKNIQIDIEGVDVGRDLSKFAELMMEESIRSLLEGQLDPTGGGSPTGRTGRFFSGGRVGGSPVGGRESQVYRAARSEVAEWIVKADQTAFDDIVGNDEALSKLREAITAPVTHAELYAAYGMKMPKGAMLYGPPGCGKTMFARAAATEMTRLYGEDVEFLSIAASMLQSPYVARTEERIKAIFAFARAYKDFKGHPLLIFIDEADALLPAREGGRPVYPWEESRVSAFLAEMDGVRESGAFVLLATNRPDALDQALLRDGRCDFKIEIKRPQAQHVETILRRQFATMPLGDPLDELVFAGIESLLDPEKVLIDGRVIRVSKDRTFHDEGGRAFLLEHALSGAMLVSMRQRSVANAFSRDKASGTVSGVTVADVIAAANDLFKENLNLNHSYALEEFVKAQKL